MKIEIRSLLSSWVKDQSLYGKCIIICSECLLNNDNVFEKISHMGDIILKACPEKEENTYFGKIATIIKCSKPRKIIVVTRDGSPHCRVLHNALLQAMFLTGSNVEHENYVVLDENLVRISRETITLSRYLSVIEEILGKINVKEFLRRSSIEYSSFSK